MPKTNTTSRTKPKRTINSKWWFTCLALLCSNMAIAKPEQQEQQYQQQTISYWKPYVVNPAKDSGAARAQRVFTNLLRTWDDTRVEPSLYVVDSARGPWAASLADGNILLSRAAIDITLAQGTDRADHLLAFVLAHELVHQRADDLWHHKFFRLVGSQTPEHQQKLQRGLDLQNQVLPDLERREAQADHDGLILMATVGYDPFVVIDEPIDTETDDVKKTGSGNQKDFFTRWVENLWNIPCRSEKGQNWQTSTIDRNAAACAQAHTRAIRSRAQLDAIATQATLFELGAQAFGAGQWQQARRYFSAYGREFPSRAVHLNIGLTHLAQALAIHDRLYANGSRPGPHFFYPLQLELRPEATPQSSGDQTRGNTEQRRLQQHAKHAVQSFERALRLEPQHRNSYLQLVIAHLLADNLPMARGVLQGNYLPRFGKDPAASLLLAMIRAREGDLHGANTDFQNLLSQMENEPLSLGDSPWPADLLIHSSFRNTVALAKAQNKNADVAALWQRMAKLAQTHHRPLLFRLAIEHMRPGSLQNRPPAWTPKIRGARLGDVVRTTARHNSFWLDGETLSIYRFDDGARWVVDSKSRLVNAWQHGGQSRLGNKLALGDTADRPLKVLGPPTRRVELVSGTYLAYDALGLAIHVEDGRIGGWYLYLPDG